MYEYLRNIVIQMFPLKYKFKGKKICLFWLIIMKFTCVGIRGWCEPRAVMRRGYATEIFCENGKWIAITSHNQRNSCYNLSMYNNMWEHRMLFVHLCTYMHLFLILVKRWCDLNVKILTRRKCFSLRIVFVSGGEASSQRTSQTSTRFTLVVQTSRKKLILISCAVGFFYFCVVWSEISVFRTWPLEQCF